MCGLSPPQEAGIYSTDLSLILMTNFGKDDKDKFEATIAQIADEVRTSATSGAASVEALNRKVFGQLGIRASADLKDPCNLLQSAVLERKRGYCVGISALYLT